MSMLDEILFASTLVPKRVEKLRLRTRETPRSNPLILESELLMNRN